MKQKDSDPTELRIQSISYEPDETLTPPKNYKILTIFSTFGSRIRDQMSLPSPSRTSSIPNFVSNNRQEIRTSHSIESPRNVTTETNLEPFNFILENKKRIRNNQELSVLVDDYFEKSILPLDFCTHLDTYVKRSESMIKLILENFEEERSTGEAPVNDYSKTLDELRKFRGVGDPVTPEFFNEFKSGYSQQISMLKKLQIKKEKLDKKLGKLKAWTKVFILAFVSVLLFSVVAALIRAPRVVTALSAAAAVPLGLIGIWLHFNWTRYERDLIGQRDVISLVQVANYGIIRDLDTIKSLVYRFQIEFDVLLSNADYSMRDYKAVVISVEEIKKNVDLVIQIIHILRDQVSESTRSTRMANTMMFRSIIGNSNSSNQDTGMFS